MDQEQGVEIGWNAFSPAQPSIPKRVERKNNRRVVAALPGNHEFGDDDLVDEEEPPRIKVRVGAGKGSRSRPFDETGLPPEVLKYQQDKERARKRFRYIAFGLVTLCVVGIIIAAALAAKAGNKNNRKANSLEQAANNDGNNGNPTQDPFQDSPSMTPTVLNGAATSTRTSAPTTTTAAVTPTNTPASTPIATTSAPTARPVVAPTLAPTSTPVATTSAPTVSAAAMPTVPPTFTPIATTSAPTASVAASTSAPTASAPVSPTIPTPSTIAMSKSEFSFAQALTISFAYGDDFVPDVIDWIGIYPTSVVAQSGLSNLGNATAYLFTCNQLAMCNSAASNGQVVFSSARLTQQASFLASWRWPVDPNQYQAFLLRGLVPPFEVLAASSTFTVKSDFMAQSVIPAVLSIDAELRAAIQNDPHLGPKFVRLGFHDCVGGCDGCVDLLFADNAGLEIPLEVLAPITARHENKTLGISRADIWALSAFVAADIAQERSDTKVDFTMEYVGRKNCEDRFDACFDMNGVQRECSSTLGPHVELPMADITSDNLLHFFSEQFGFTVQETVAIMGAHTLGSLAREHSGFPGPNGWVRDNLLLDHDYYRELMGGGSRDDDLETLIETAPDWFRFDIDNSDLDGMPNRRAWQAFPPAFDGSGPVEILMLTADVSLVRNITNDVMSDTGRIACSFNAGTLAEGSTTQRCPHAERSFGFWADYKFDNDLWLHDFELVYKKMLNHGYPYDPDRFCPSGLCSYNDIA